MNNFVNTVSARNAIFQSNKNSKKSTKKSDMDENSHLSSKKRTEFNKKISQTNAKSRNNNKVICKMVLKDVNQSFDTNASFSNKSKIENGNVVINGICKDNQNNIITEQLPPDNILNIKVKNKNDINLLNNSNSKTNKNGLLQLEKSNDTIINGSKALLIHKNKDSSDIYNMKDEVNESNQNLSINPFCRICLEEENTLINALISPCPCKGSSQHVHEQCLNHRL